MKNLHVIILLFISLNTFSQKVVKSVSVDSDWGLNVLDLYDDSTYTFAQRGCTNVYFSVGQYSFIDNKPFLYPTQIDSLNLIDKIELLEADSCVQMVEVEFVSKDGNKFQTETAIVNLEDGNQWINDNSTEEYYLIKAKDVMLWDTVTYKNIRPDCTDFALCLIGYSNVFKRKILIPISEKTYKVNIYTPFPNDIIYFSMMGILRYEKLENGTMKIGQTEIFIENK